MAEIMRIFVLAVLIGVSGVATAEFAESPFTPNSSSKASALFLLGDSSVDCGENTLFYPLIHGNFSLLPCDGSDSNLLPHLLAEKIGLPYSAPFYSQNGSIKAIQKGINYGSAKATIMNPSTSNYQSLNQQIRQVSETFQLLQLQLGQTTASQFIQSSIFYLSFGKDDYTELYLKNASGIMTKHSGQEFARILVDQMETAVKDLYDSDVMNFIIVGILPLGCTPRIVSEWGRIVPETDQNGCVGEINELVLQFNMFLEERIVRLNEELPGSRIVFIDVFRGIMEIVSDPGVYGFEDAHTPCCGIGMIGCLSRQMACGAASERVWWDLFSPTGAVNSLLADSVWISEPLPGICRPGSIQDLVYS